MILAAFFIYILYGFLVLYMTHGIGRLKDLDFDGSEPEASFSILVPFRNEELNLTGLLQSITSLNYPTEKFELILINDASSDTSASIVQQCIEQYPNLKIKLIDSVRQSGSPKKDALDHGIQQASFEWIVTTDADCVVPVSWLSAFDNMIRQQPLQMIVAPVSYRDQKGFFHRFQMLDFISLQGITMGSFGMKDKNFGHPFLCNGANLCYKKDCFNEVNGFVGNQHIASGDDVFLLEKIYQKFPDEVQFIKSKEAIVYTSSKDTFRGLVQQRVRWAAKTNAYNSIFAKLIGLLVFMTSFMMVILFILGSIGQLPWLHVGFLFLLKFNIDFVLLFKTSQFFAQEKVMKSYFVSSLLHPFYTVFVVLLSFNKTYTWKDRSY